MSAKTIKVQCEGCGDKATVAPPEVSVRQTIGEKVWTRVHRDPRDASSDPVWICSPDCEVKVTRLNADGSPAK